MFASISPTPGTQPFNDWFVSDTVQRQPLGMTVTAVDPYWGTGKFVYLKSNDGLRVGQSWRRLPSEKRKSPRQRASKGRFQAMGVGL